MDHGSVMQFLLVLLFYKLGCLGHEFDIERLVKLIIRSYWPTVKNDFISIEHPISRPVKFRTLE
jgi:hypothetical protein